MWRNQPVNVLQGTQVKIDRFFSRAKSSTAAAGTLSAKSGSLNATMAQDVHSYNNSDQNQKQQQKEDQQQHHPPAAATVGRQHARLQQVHPEEMQLLPSGSLDDQSKPHHNDQQQQQENQKLLVPQQLATQQQQQVDYQSRPPLVPALHVLQQLQQPAAEVVQEDTAAAAAADALQQLPRLQGAPGVPMLACEVPGVTAATPIITCGHQVYGVLAHNGRKWVVYCMDVNGNWRRLTSTEFEQAGGRGACRSWKQTCKVQVGACWVKAKQWLAAQEQ
jgi:hypothetical protein